MRCLKNVQNHWLIIYYYNIILKKKKTYFINCISLDFTQYVVRLYVLLLTGLDMRSRGDDNDAICPTDPVTISVRFFPEYQCRWRRDIVCQENVHVKLSIYTYRTIITVRSNRKTAKPDELGRHGKPRKNAFEMVKNKMCPATKLHVVQYQVSLYFYLVVR